MIHHCVLCKLLDEVDDERVEWMIRNARSQLLKIGEALNVRSGRAVDPEARFPFFYSVDTESMDKLAILKDDPFYIKFVSEVIDPFTHGRVPLDYEMEPGKELKYS